MNLQQLRHFVTLAETGNVRKAANRRHMRQPPLSVSIRRLGRDPGVVLFSREVSGVRLTAAGVSVPEQARSALFFLQQVRDVVEAETAGEGGCRYASGRIALRKLSGVSNPANTGIALAYRPDLETAVGRRFRETVKEIAARAVS